jgi:hypothetical protein
MQAPALACPQDRGLWVVNGSVATFAIPALSGPGSVGGRKRPYPRFFELSGLLVKI